MIIHKNRTNTYIATVNLKSTEDLKWVKTIRAAVKETNVFYRDRGDSTRKYVKLQGRGHRMGNPDYNCSLPLTFAVTADVYIYER